MGEVAGGREDIPAGESDGKDGVGVAGEWRRGTRIQSCIARYVDCCF